MATLNLHPIRLSILGTPLVGQEVEVRVLIGHPMETGYRLGLDGNERIPKNIIEEKITHPLTLSEIYNLEREVEFYDEDKKPKPKVIGFGN